MISEGSCDTEELTSNDAENSALITRINYILQYIQIEFYVWNCDNINYFYYIFGHIL